MTSKGVRKEYIAAAEKQLCEACNFVATALLQKNNMRAALDLLVPAFPARFLPFPGWFLTRDLMRVVPDRHNRSAKGHPDAGPGVAFRSHMRRSVPYRLDLQKKQRFTGFAR